MNRQTARRYDAKPLLILLLLIFLLIILAGCNPFRRARQTEDAEPTAAPTATEQIATETTAPPTDTIPAPMPTHVLTVTATATITATVRPTATVESSVENTATIAISATATMTASPPAESTFTSPLATPDPSFLFSPLDVPVEGSAPVYSYEVIASYPHDPNAFTQGLVYLDGVLYEGTGLRGQSSLRKVELESGDVLEQHDLAPQYFGEGIAILGDKIYQLTWQSGVGFVYDLETFEEREEFTYPTEGWGITHDGETLIMSDGTSTLYLWDPDTLEEIGRLSVTDAGEPVTRLNELEYVDGEILANIWQTNRIARISPASGQVIGWIDLANILRPEHVNAPVDVLNGIAYDEENERLFVTGKLWPRIYEIELVPPQ